MSPVWKEMGDLVTQYMKEVEVLHDFLALVFSSESPKHMAQARPVMLLLRHRENLVASLMDVLFPLPAFLSVSSTFF